MTEIENIKKQTLASFIKDSLEKDAKIASLITTIESQKEEMESKDNFFKGYDHQSRLIESQLRTEIESLKAITELAVKGLKSIAGHTGPKTGEDAWEMFQEAEYTLSEIARLSHEQNS